MNCTQIRPLFSPYMDDALSIAEMRAIAAHLEGCPACAAEQAALQRTQELIAALGRQPAPADLALRIQLAAAQRRGIPFAQRVQAFSVRLENAVNSFMLPATAGLVTAVLIFGLFVGFFVAPPTVSASNDVPTSLYVPPRLAASPFHEELNADNPVVIEALIGANGRLEDYRILAGGEDPKIRKQLDRSLLFAVFEPAIIFGQPTHGRLILSFTGVNVKG